MMVILTLQVIDDEVIDDDYLQRKGIATGGPTGEKSAPKKIRLEKMPQEYRLMYYKLDLIQKLEPIDVRVYAASKTAELKPSERKRHKKHHADQGTRANKNEEDDEASAGTFNHTLSQIHLTHKFTTCNANTEPIFVKNNLLHEMAAGLTFENSCSR